MGGDLVGQIETIDISRCGNCGAQDFAAMGLARDFEFQSCTNDFEFVRCKRCGMGWLRNRPTLAALPIIYSPDYATYSYDEYLGGTIAKARDQVQRMKIRAFSRYAKAGATVADVGCGNGALLRLMQRFGDPSWTLIGVDIAESSLTVLRRHGIRGLCGRFEEVAWDGPQPDVIVMNQVIEHLEDPQRSVQRAFDLLKPGGVLVIETPSLDGWDCKLFAARYWGGWHTPRHWHLFTEETLGQTLRRHGFEISEATYLLNPYAWLQSMRFWLDDAYGWKRAASFFQVNVLPALVLASTLDLIQKLIHRRTSNLRMVGRKPE